jgi:hypothetical protein
MRTNLSDHSTEQGRSRHTTNKLDQSPQTEQYEQTRKLTLLTPKHDFQDERREYDGGIEEVQSGVGNGSEWVVSFRAESPEGDGYFEHEERGDEEGYGGEDVEPPGCVGTLYRCTSEWSGWGQPEWTGCNVGSCA